MSLDIKKKIYISFAITILWIPLGFFFGYLVLEIGVYFLIPLFLLFFSVGIYTLLVRCPKCGKPVFYNYFFWSPWAPRKCRRCGYKLY